MVVEGKTELAKDSKISKRKNIFNYLGPALITSALVLGPGSVTLSSKIGAIYGTQLVWTIILAIILMMVFTEMSTRIGLAADHSFIQTIKKKWGLLAGVLIGVGAFLVTASFQAGNAIGTGIAISTVTNMDPTIWIIIFTLISIGLLFAKQFYQILEKMMLVLVVIMLLAFLITVIVVQPSLVDIFKGFIPVLPEGSMGLIIALFATSFSIVGAVYQSYLVKEKGWKITDAASGRKESFLGIFLLGFISFLIMITAATILKPQGLIVNDASEMGLALEPLFGNWSTIVFMLGLFGASFSSLMGNATIGGSLLADGLGIGSNLSNMKVKLLIILVMLFGSIIGIVFGSAPLNLIVFAQAITIFVVPFIAIAILVVANDKNIMGELKNKLLSNVLGIIGLIVLIYLAFNNIKNIFFS
ncbi:Nramp family divalent metal transporter [Psychrobacillus psychrodurans]|uniref:Nramp family divalent metal transporter n=1 Tax=Psychrobacillus psychrodurans TaxID=126157 RepID=UPI0008EF6131|nr:Nramp family divalent metal transporter [Psychrobacillus psychrodurans]SFM28171.1 Mn2+ and Fe2+ transporters of the NRAMP family [Psychrobacillus psychrodurans]